MSSQSKKQLRFMAAVANGSLKKPGLDPKKAQEFVDTTKSYRDLPEQKRKFNKLSKYIK